MLRDLLSDLRYRFQALIDGDTAERDLNDELRFHLDRETDRFIREGLTPDAARRRARLAFGDLEQVKESSRDVRGIRLIEHLGRDLGHSLRLTMRNPGFALVVVLSLGLGIGAATSVFNLTYNVLFAPLAVPHPEQLIALERVGKDGRDDAFAWGEYRALSMTPGVGTFAAARGASAVSIAIGEHHESINLDFLEGSYFPLLGVRPVHGRLLTTDDDARQAAVVVLAQWFAERLYPGDPSAIGKTILIRGAPFVVVGVTPHSFRGLEYPGWFTAAIPLGSVALLGNGGPGHDNRGQLYGTGDDRPSDRRAFTIVGRLNMDPSAARAALALAFQHCCRAFANETGDQANQRLNENLDVVDIRHGIPGSKGDFRPQARTILTILLAGMALLLVVVCCNIASLLLVRSAARRREIAVRLALGASRARLVGQLVMENVPCAIAGGVGGLLIAAWYTTLFIRNLPLDWTDGADPAEQFGFHPGPALLIFAVSVTALCGVAFSVYPALRATRQHLAQALRLDMRASRARGQGAVARGVVVAQVAVTVVLVTAAGLFATTLGNLARVNGGFATEQMLLAGIEARSTRYEQAGLVPVAEEIIRRVRAVPGVRTAAAAALVPLYGGSNWRVGVRVPSYVGAPDKLPTMRLIAITPGYLGASEIRLESGRDLTEADNSRSGRVVIVSDAFARRFFADRKPLGQSVGVQLAGDTLTSVRIVGVAGDASYDDLRQGPQPLLYFPLSQAPGAEVGVQLVVRTRGEPTAMASAVMRAIEAAAPGVTVRRVQDMRTVRDQVMMVERLAARLAAFVSAMALVLAAVGLYGVVAYSVSARTSEIGIRLALGARPRAVLWLVAKESIALVGIGVLAGVPLSFAAHGALGSQLFGVGAHDPAPAALSILLLALAGLVASVVPARRATRIDPRTALNAD